MPDHLSAAPEREKAKQGLHIASPFALWASPMTAAPAFLLRRLLALVYKTLSKQLICISFHLFIYLSPFFLGGKGPFH